MNKEQAFDLWYWHVDEWEGSSLSDPPKRVDRDHVPTKHGIRFDTWKRLAPMLFGFNGDNLAPFENMTREQHKAIAMWYWDRSGAHYISDGRIAAVFAEAFWGGGYSAIRWFQSSLNSKYGTKLSIDGRVGKLTASVINAADQDELFSYLIGELEARYRHVAKNPKLAKNLKGWLNRVNGDQWRRGLRKTLTVTHCECCGQIIKQ